MTFAIGVWRGVKLAGLLAVGGAIALLMWLANGGADLPRHPRLISQGAGFPPALAAAEFTLAVGAATGRSAQPWGIACGPLRLLVHPAGYVYAGDGAPDWREFPHVSRWRNELYLHVDERGSAFYINRELVARLPAPGFGPIALIGAEDLSAVSTTLWLPE
ncbi:MAG: hypothetical protein ACUVS2_02305 [Candidatus Flexifilum sp.]